DIHWRREVVDDGVEHCLDALVLESRATEHRYDEAADSRAPDGVTNLLDRQLLVPEILLDQTFVMRDGSLDHVVARLLHPLAILFRHFGDLELLAEGFVVEDV